MTKEGLSRWWKIYSTGWASNNAMLLLMPAVVFGAPCLAWGVMHTLHWLGMAQ